MEILALKLLTLKKVEGAVMKKGLLVFVIVLVAMMGCSNHSEDTILNPEAPSMNVTGASSIADTLNWPGVDRYLIPAVFRIIKNNDQVCRVGIEGVPEGKWADAAVFVLCPLGRTYVTTLYPASFQFTGSEIIIDEVRARPQDILCVYLHCVENGRSN